MELTEYIKKNEGEVTDNRGRHVIYKCPAGKYTIGWGRNLSDQGITEREAEILLQADLASSTQDLYQIFGTQIETFSPNRHMALVDIMFNIGISSFRGFKKMIRAIKEGKWKQASIELLDSKYAKDVPSRAQKNATYLLKG